MLDASTVRASSFGIDRVARPARARLFPRFLTVFSPARHDMIAIHFTILLQGLWVRYCVEHPLHVVPKLCGILTNIYASSLSRLWRIRFGWTLRSVSGPAGADTANSLLPRTVSSRKQTRE